MNPHLRPNRPNGHYYHGIVSTPPNCAYCPLRYKVHKMVKPDGPVPAKLAFIGEEPGRQEERQGRGFVGPSGRLLWSVLGPECGFSREDVWVTNALLCKAERVRLANGAILEHETVKQLAADCCARRLIDELRAVDPVVAVPLGSTANKQITRMQKASIYAFRGSRKEVDFAALSERLYKESIGAA